MSFFGLTALGPQNIFQTSLVDFSYLDVFSADDLQEAFKASDADGRGYLETEQITEFLTHLYRGQPKGCDVERFMARLGSPGDVRLTLDTIRQLMNELKQEVDMDLDDAKWHRGSGSEFESNREYRETVRRHQHLGRQPRMRYSTPMTAVQEYGWHDQDEKYKQMIRGKMSCPETVYASELVKSGVYF